MHAGIAALIAL